MQNYKYQKEGYQMASRLKKTAKHLQNMQDMQNMQSMQNYKYQKDQEDQMASRLGKLNVAVFTQVGKYRIIHL